MEVKAYEHQEDEIAMVSESVGAYYSTSGREYPQENHIVAYDDMPCVYTDDEFKVEVSLAEASGFVSDEEFKKSCFERWGVEL